MAANSLDFNNVKAEKAEALRKYNRQKMIKNLFFLLEVFATLALVSWFSSNHLSIVAQIVRDFLSQHVVVFSRSLYVFVIVNVLALLIFVLSSQKPVEKTDLYEEYVNFTTTNPAADVTESEKSQAPDEEIICDKQIVHVNNVVKSSPVEEKIVSIPDCEPKPAVSVVSPVNLSRAGEVTEMKKKFRRTRSEKVDRENINNQRRCLQRSETVVKKDIVAVPARRSSAMDDLSSEEFRMKIETFIASKKKTLIRENTLDKHSLAITSL